MIDLKHLLFSFKGRIGRQYWWLTSLAVAFMVGMANGLIELAGESLGQGTVDPAAQEFELSGIYVALFVLAVGNLWINYALIFKRLHDRDRSGWWIFLPLLVAAAGVLLTAWGASLRGDDSNPLLIPGILIAALGIGLGFWIFIEVGFLKGTTGPNRFGPDPLSPKAEAGAAPKLAAG
jgi:uncharacterized membrane protein YhaH (DUF805 family)